MRYPFFSYMCKSNVIAIVGMSWGPGAGADNTEWIDRMKTKPVLLTLNVYLLKNFSLGTKSPCSSWSVAVSDSGTTQTTILVLIERHKWIQGKCKETDDWAIIYKDFSLLVLTLKTKLLKIHPDRDRFCRITVVQTLSTLFTANLGSDVVGDLVVFRWLGADQGRRGRYKVRLYYSNKRQRLDI